MGVKIGGGRAEKDASDARADPCIDQGENWSQLTHEGSILRQSLQDDSKFVW